MREIAKTAELFDLTKTLASPLLSEYEYAWEVLPKIKDFILSLGNSLPSDEYIERDERVWIAKGAKVADSALIIGPTVICEGAQIRHGAFIRGGVLVGRGSVVGNSCEVKNSIIFDSVQIPHYNYVGDSVLGYRAHLGAGAVTSNVKSDRSRICVSCDGERVETGLLKFGALIGDGVEIGCNSVLCPGTVIGRNCTVYPLVRVRGFLGESSIHKGDSIVKKR